MKQPIEQSGSSPVRWLAVGISGLVAVATLVAAVATGPLSSGSADRRPAITVTGFSCGKGWSLPQSGQRQLTIVNTGTSVVDVQLVGAHSLVYGQIEAMAPGTSRMLAALIPPGRYQLHCIYSENAIVSSTALVVTGPPVTGAHPYVPATYAEMAPSVSAYRAAVATGLATLATDTDRLMTLANHDQLADAQQAWLTAHLDYERLGAAYDTFGDFNDQINGRPDGLPMGILDPNWSGFLRLEYALWHGQSPTTVATVADQLDTAVHGLVAAFPEQMIPPNDLSLRTHEILENTLQFVLTGATDEGSHSDLATALANVEGTQMTLSAIALVVARQNPKLLDSLQSKLAVLTALLGAYQGEDNQWVPLGDLSQAQRQRIDSAMGDYLETVVPLPDLLQLSPEAQNP